MTKKLDTSNISAFAQKIGMVKDGMGTPNPNAEMSSNLPEATNADRAAHVSKIPPRELRNKRFNLLMSPSAFERLEILKERTGRSVNDLINFAIDELLKGEGL